MKSKEESEKTRDLAHPRGSKSSVDLNEAKKEEAGSASQRIFAKGLLCVQTLCNEKVPRKHHLCHGKPKNHIWTAHMKQGCTI